MTGEDRPLSEIEQPAKQPQPTFTTSDRTWVPYAVPMAAFLVITYLESMAGKLYPIVYIVKAILVTILLIVFRSNWRDIKPSVKVIVPGIAVGLLVCAEWVLLENWLHYPHLGSRTAYSPFVEIANPTTRLAFIAIRFYGLALMVPVMEELFWRSFLVRYFSDPDHWSKMEVGAFTWGGFAMVCGLFGLAHPEWLVAVICAVAYGLLLKQTKSLFACIIAHSVTNLALGIYVMTSHDWKFW